MKVLFEKARRKRPSIIFFDEVDALCGRRSDSHSATDTGMKNEMLVQMDGFNKNNSDVLLIAATNAPWRLDPAFIRRFERRIYIPMPDENARRELLKIESGLPESPDSADAFDRLAKETKGLSGGDIKVLVRQGFQRGFQRAMEAEFFYQVGNIVSASIRLTTGHRIRMACTCRARPRTSRKRGLKDVPGETSQAGKWAPCRVTGETFLRR
jgi:vacuolar protein-sorting-associated protein 4